MSDWQARLEAFFELRGREVAGVPTLAELCWIAGRDPRVWTDAARRDDLTRSILGLCGADARSAVLEVGCAAGFLASLVAPGIGRYVGVDLAEAPLRVARLLGLPNAEFRVSDGAALPFADASFDAAFCYDVFTNFPTAGDGKGIIAEMLRVVRPGGAVLVGSIPDRAAASGLPARIAEVAAELEARHGPPPPPPTASLSPTSAAPTPPPEGWLGRLLRRLTGAAAPSAAAPSPPAAPPPAAPPEIVCYEFGREEFADLAAQLGAAVEIHEIHALNPYRGFRFNAVFRRPPAPAGQA